MYIVTLSSLPVVSGMQVFCNDANPVQVDGKCHWQAVGTARVY